MLKYFAKTEVPRLLWHRASLSIGCKSGGPVNRHLVKNTYHCMNIIIAMLSCTVLTGTHLTNIPGTAVSNNEMNMIPMMMTMMMMIEGEGDDDDEEDEIFS